LFARCRQATWLIPRGGITVAGQRRNHTGFAATTPTGEYVPGGASLLRLRGRWPFGGGAL
jgi:hypothetical protein